jgi:hypothetical protein
MSRGEKMVWAASFVAARDRDSSEVGVAKAIARAGEAVYSLRTAYAMIDKDLQNLGPDVKHSYEQILYDADDPEEA